MKKKLIFIMSLVFILICNFNLVNASTISTSKLNIYFIDVGQADCQLIENNGHFALIDAGNNADEATVISFLKSKGVKKLDLIIATHPHEDHIGSMDAVVRTFGFDTIIMPKVTTTTKTFSNLVNAVKSKNKTATIPIVGKKYKIGNAELTILAPNGTKYSDLNDYSVVTRVTYGSNSFLFMGDAETISENQILSKKLTVKSDVLKVGHHGSNSSTSQAFLNVVNPKYAVIEVGKDNNYGFPKATTLSKLNTKGIKVYRTDINGTITASSDGSKIIFSVQKQNILSGISLLAS